MNAKCMGECMEGDSAGSNPRICLKKRRIEKFITSYAFLPSDTDSARRDTNKHTNKHQIKAVWTLASARRY